VHADCSSADCTEKQSGIVALFCNKYKQECKHTCKFNRNVNINMHRYCWSNVYMRFGSKASVYASSYIFLFSKINTVRTSYNNVM